MPLTQPTGSVHEFQPGPPPPVPYFANYASPQQIQAPYHSMRSSSIRGRSSGSRKSFSGEPFPSAPPPMANPPEQTLLAESLAPASQGAEDESIDLLQRIQSAIPDLHLLLNRYKETSGQLGVRETLIRETEAQKAAALKQKEAHIEKLEKEMENVSNKHSAESSKLRLEVGNMEEKHKELQDSLGNMEGKHKELQGSLIAEKDSKAELELAYRTVKAEKEQLERRLQEERANINHEINLWNQKTSQNQADLQSSWEIDLKRLKQESEARLQAREAQLSESWELERSSLQAGWATQKREIEDSHSRLRRDWEATLDSRQKTIEECRRKQSQDREAWNRERDALSRSWGEERTLLGKGWAEQRTILTAQHQNEKDELERKLRDSHAQAIKTAEERQTKLEKENERIKTGWEADKAKFSKATADLKNAAAKLNDENVKLQKLAEAFGDVTDLKSREDPF